MSDSHGSAPGAVHPPPPGMPPAPLPPSTVNAPSTTQAGPNSITLPTNGSTHPNIALGEVSIHLEQPATESHTQAVASTGDSNATSTGAGTEMIDPVLLAADQAAAQEALQDMDAEGEPDEEGFDPATLANLAALSRIAHEEEDDTGLDLDVDDGADAEGAEADGEPQASGSGEQDSVHAHDLAQDQGMEPGSQQGQGQGQGQGLSGDQVDAVVQGLQGANKAKRKRDPKKKERSVSQPRSRGSVGDKEEGEYSDDDDSLRDKEEDSDMEGKDDKDGKYYYDNGKLKRKRNRTVLSCTECHRRCDRNIPCKRCIRRGVASMCRMEAPVMPERKRRKPLEESPVNYELGLRVQALETLIRAGTSMDADTANSAAMDTILQATKAAGKGNVIAGNALANLSTAAGMDLEGLESGERAGLLMEVLQQLSDASMPPKVRAEPEVPLDPTDDPWSTIPKARSTLQTYQPPNPPNTNPNTESQSQNQTQTQSQPPSDPDAPYPKLDLTLQGFREDNGRIFIPPTVRYVEKTMRADKESVLARDALPIQGDEQFFKEGTRLIYGAESTVWKRGLVSAVQAHTITGALRIAASFLSRFPPGPIPGAPKAVYCPTPTTPEDELAMKESGLDVRRFRFLDQESGAVDWAGIREDLQEATPRSVVLLYVSGTVPTGVEINASQWRILTTLLAERQLVPLCVLPFQGLSSGDVDRDAQPVKFMVHEGLPVVVVQSFDAGMGIYADSPSIISVATQSTETKDRVDSQLRAAARAYHSHPAPWGAHIVWSILSDSKLYPAWMNEIKAMSGRLRSVREKLYDVLTNKLKTPGSWLHIKRSSGMLCTALLPPSQVSSLAQSRNIHLNMDGSFSLGALNAPRIEVLAKGIDYVVRQSIREQEEAQAQAIAMELALAAAREQAAKEEAEAAERAARDAEEKAREEDTLLMEASIADAMEMQRREEEEEKRREEERREMDEAIRKAAERADMQRRAEEILASIGAMN